MPVKSKAQQGYIFGLRNKYKSESQTPEKYKWIWDSDYEKIPKDLPDKIQNEFTEYVLESLHLNELNSIKDSDMDKLIELIKMCNSNIYTKDKQKLIIATEILSKINDIIQPILADEKYNTQFDTVTIIKDAKQINKNILLASKLAYNIKQLQQRLESVYEDTAFKLTKYFEI